MVASDPPDECPVASGGEREFRASLDVTVNVDAKYRRVVATAEQAKTYYDAFALPGDHVSELLVLAYGQLQVTVSTDIIAKMFGWVRARSRGFTVEVQGRFLAKRHPDHLEIYDFVPMPSFCQSLAYETSGVEDRIARFGAAKVRSIGLDDWKPRATHFYRVVGVFSDFSIPIDPLAVPIPFHSHYLKSCYQDGPSPGDYDHIFHIKWLYAPVTGKSILYSGVSPFQVEVPLRLPAARDAGTILDWVGTLNNPEDCELSIVGESRVFTLGEAAGDVVIGRDPACAVTLADDEASRRHARLYWDEGGELVLEDLGSRNGTWIDEVRVDRRVIAAPTAFVVGNTTLEIRF